MITRKAGEAGWGERTSTRFPWPKLPHLLLALALVAGPAMAEDWSRLDTEEITDALAGRTLDYKNAWQDFRASGRTLYNAGADSWGQWEARDGKYCSQWPPNSAWACFDVERSADGRQIKFVGSGNDVTVGTYRQ